MATLLKIVSAIYLLFVWFVFFAAINAPAPMFASVGSDTAVKLMTFTVCGGLSIPAAALFAFAQIVADIRVIKNNARHQTEHLDAMRSYCEPDRRQRAS